MTSKFAPSRSIPTGFDEELRFFSKEILRSWPGSTDSNAEADPRGWILQVR